MSPVKIILIIIIAAVYLGLILEVVRTKEVTDKTNDGEKIDRAATKKDKVFMAIAATGIGGLMLKYIIEWQ